MHSRGKHCIAVLAALATMAFAPSAAQAQGFALLHHDTPDGTLVFQSAAGQVLTLTVSQLDATGNEQTVAGVFNGAAMAGVVVSHTYDNATDTGKYGILGTLAAPNELPVPVLATVGTSLDRAQGNYVLKIQGTLGNTPFVGEEHSFTNPFYGVL